MPLLLPMPMPLLLPMPLMPLMLLCCRCQPPTIMCHWPRWLAIAATAYAKSNGYFPDPTTALTYKDWGGLAQLGFNEYISNERAIIMIAHVHALTISACAAFGPQVLGDTLTLLDGEEDEEPYGVFIPVAGQTGLTPAAEMMNGRMAMFGLIALVLGSCVSGKDILEVFDVGVGGLYGLAK